MSYIKSYKNTLQDILYLVPLSAFFLFFDLGKGSLASWDEAIYATVAKELIQSGDWFHLTLGGSPWVDKPPLSIWATALCYHFFGINEFAARFYSAFMGLGSVFVTYLLGRALLSRWVGFMGALVLLSSSHFIHFARFGMMDAPLTFFISLALYFFWLGREKNRFLILSGVAIGLALMTKGFAAFFIFPIVWIYCLLSQEMEVLGRSSYWIGIMIAVAIALPWHLWELFIHRSIFVNEVFVKHLFGRTLTALEGHKGNYYFYIRTLVNKYHPWVLVGIVSGPLFLFKAIRERTSESIFLSVWIFFILSALTLIQTKLNWYILPIYPALSLTVGAVLANIFKENRKVFIRLMFLVVMALHVPYSHIFSHDYSRDLKGIAPLVEAQVPREATLFLYNYHEIPAALFYIGRPNRYLDSADIFTQAAKQEGPFYCLIHELDLQSFSHRLPELGLSVKGSFENLRLVSK